MRQRTLREVNGIERECGDGADGDFRVGDAARQSKYAEQAEGAYQQHGAARHQRRVAKYLPRERQVGKQQRRMCIGNGGRRDKRAGEEDVTGSGDVVAGFVPEVGKTQKRPVQKDEGDPAQDEQQDRVQRAASLHFGE